MPSYLTCSICGHAFKRYGQPSSGRIFCGFVCMGISRRKPHPKPVKIVAPVPVTVSEDGLSAWVPLYARDGAIRAHTVVDVADVSLVNKWVWRLHHGYAARVQRTDGSLYYFSLHRVILGLEREDGRDVDHINRDRLDNRRVNLRPISPAENAQNRTNQTTARSKYRGVAWYSPDQKWRVRVTASGKVHYFGYFTDEDAAGVVAKAARARLLPFSVD